MYYWFGDIFAKENMDPFSTEWRRAKTKDKECERERKPGKDVQLAIGENL
jgi:hypothetical protein